MFVIVIEEHIYQQQSISISLLDIAKTRRDIGGSSNSKGCGTNLSSSESNHTAD